MINLTPYNEELLFTKHKPIISVYNVNKKQGFFKVKTGERWVVSLHATFLYITGIRVIF